MPTTVMELLRRITEAPRSDYLIVDIGDGRRWLTSRLYLFSFMLWRIGVVRCVAFVETSGAYRKRLLGLAEPAMVCAALGTRYPWFDKALVQASSLKGDELSLTAVPLPREQAQKMVDRMISNPLIRQPEIPEAPEEWELFKPGED